MEINGTAALVTGGASGLGQAAGRLLVDLGAKVTLLDLPGARLERTAETLGCQAIPCDVTDAGQAEEALESASRRERSSACAGELCGGGAGGADRREERGAARWISSSR